LKIIAETTGLSLEEVKNMALKGWGMENVPDRLNRNSAHDAVAFPRSPQQAL
jgi:hypothetical protein